MIGAKLGLTSRVKRQALGIHEPVFGRLTSGMVVPHGQALQLDELIHPRAEPEIAFLIRKRIEAPTTVAQVLAATEAVMRQGYGFSPYREQVARAHQTAAQFITAYEKAGVPPDGVRVLTKWMNIGVSCLPAFFLIDIIVVFVLSLVMFGRLKAWREFVNRRDANADRGPIAAAYLFRNFSLPEWLLFAFIIGGLTPLASGMLQKVAANILAVVTFLYLLQGLAIFRSLLVAVGAGFGGVMFGYLLLGILTITGIAPILLSIAGLFDSFFDFRHFKRKDHSDESHPH